MTYQALEAMTQTNTWASDPQDPSDAAELDKYLEREGRKPPSDGINDTAILDYLGVPPGYYG